MLDEAIELIEKWINMYIVQDSNIERTYRKQTIVNRAKDKLQKTIRILDYILEILKQKKGEKNE